MSTSAMVWLGAILGLASYSFIVFGDNPVFGLSEHLVVGTAAGYAIGLAILKLLEIGIRPMAKGQVILLIPLALGLLLYAKFLPRHAWLARVPMSFMIGISLGVQIRGSIQSDVLDQIRATMVAPTNLTNIVLILGVFCSISYFFMTVQNKKGTGKWLSTLGKWVLMAAFGAGFASTVTGRFSLLIKEFQYLLGDWLGLIH